jgi:hypothetical protein
MFYKNMNHAKWERERERERFKASKKSSNIKANIIVIPENYCIETKLLLFLYYIFSHNMCILMNWVAGLTYFSLSPYIKGNVRNATVEILSTYNFKHK